MSVANRIILIGKGRYEEATASGLGPNTNVPLQPGSLIMQDSNLAVLPHNVPGGACPAIFAIEDAMRGYPHNVFDAYVVGDLIPHTIAEKGDVINALLAPGASVTQGQPVMSNGDGSLTPASIGGDVVLVDSVAAGANQTGTTAATALAPNTTIAANELQVGDIIHVRGVVAVSAVAGTDTLAVSLTLGSVTIFTTATFTAVVGTVAVFDAYIVVQAIGSSGTIVATGTDTIGAAGTATEKPFYLAPATLNTTIANVLAVNTTWSATASGDVAALQEVTMTLQRGGNTPLAISQETNNNSANSTPAHFAVRVI